MRPIGELSAKDASHIRCVLFDIDDTITTGGKLTADAYQSIWDLSDAGLRQFPSPAGPPAGAISSPDMAG